MRCDRSQSERATTLITFNETYQLVLCDHHTREVIDGLVEQNKSFSAERLDQLILNEVNG